MGKGSAVRPSSVDRDTWSRNWERVFGGTRPRPDTQWGPGFVYDPKAAFAVNWERTFGVSRFPDPIMPGAAWVEVTDYTTGLYQRREAPLIGSVDHIVREMKDRLREVAESER